MHTQAQRGSRIHRIRGHMKLLQFALRIPNDSGVRDRLTLSGTTPACGSCEKGKHALGSLQCRGRFHAAIRIYFARYTGAIVCAPAVPISDPMRISNAERMKREKLRWKRGRERASERAACGVRRAASRSHTTECVQKFI